MNATQTKPIETLPLLEPLAGDLRAVVDKLRGAATIELELLDEALAYVVAAGGKLIRPALAISAACSYRDVDEKVISLAASVEMLHTATLVHDDMIDGAARRRGNPTLHNLLSPTSAVLLGDFLFAQAAAWAAETDSIRVVRIFSETLMIIVRGELRQLWAQFNLERAVEDYQARIFGKTAALFATATEAGAILGGAREREIQALREYGRLFGLAFQIVDDVLDYVGDATRMGKPVGSDLRNGNITLPVILYLRDYDRDGLAERYFYNNSLTSEQVEDIISRVIGSPALQASLTTARRLSDEAKQALDILPQNEHVERLRLLADYIVERNL